MKSYPLLCFLFLLFTSTVTYAITDAEKEMSDWLSHPMEFNQPPVEIKEIHREFTEWPLADSKIEIVFHRYRMKDGYVGIGMTGPITWSFIGNKLQEEFSFDELKRIYAGWYVSFLAVNGKNFDSVKNNAQKVAKLKELRAKNKNIIEMEDYLLIGKLIFYAYKEMRGDTEIVIATDLNHPREYPKDSKYLRLPILYHYIGSLFFDGQL